MAASAAIILGGLLTACGDNDSAGKGDAPVGNSAGQRVGDDSPAQVYNFPNHFPNVATKCTGPGFRAFVTTDRLKPVIMPDPACK